MRIAIVVLATLALFVLLIAGSCAAWGFTAHEEGADFVVAFVGLPTLLVGMALALAAGICAVIDAGRQHRRRWFASALIVTLLGGPLPCLALVGAFVAVAFSTGNSADSLTRQLIDSSASVGLVGSFILPLLIPPVALVYAAAQKAGARAARVAEMPYANQPSIAHPYAPGAPQPREHTSPYEA